jgi:predicted phage-related endonuclease
MAIILDDFEQRSETWFLHRLGNVGCSGMSNIITPQGVLSKSREDYLHTLAAEKLSGRSDEKYQSQNMINGTEREDSTRSLFELIYGVEVRQVGIVYKDEFRLYHCSPDGLINGNAMLEQKNPLGKTMVKCLLDRTLPSEYFVQCQGSLYVCERDLLYFMVAYEGIEPMILEVRRDEKFISLLAKALDDFVCDLHAVVERLKKL